MCNFTHYSSTSCSSLRWLWQRSREQQSVYARQMLFLPDPSDRWVHALALRVVHMWHGPTAPIHGVKIYRVYYCINERTEKPVTQTHAHKQLHKAGQQHDSDARHACTVCFSCNGALRSLRTVSEMCCCKLQVAADSRRQRLNTHRHIKPPCGFGRVGPQQYFAHTHTENDGELAALLHTLWTCTDE